MIDRRDMRLGCGLLIALAFVAGIVVLGISGMWDGPGTFGRDSIGVISITGIILDPEPTVDILDRYREDDSVLGVVVRLDTPGGGVSATQEIVDAVLRVRNAGKPVIVSMGSVAASGGYYIAASCDTIVTTPGTITGSIGVIARFTDMSDLLDKVGIEFNVVKSGKYKDVGSFSRKMTEEERALIEDMVMNMYDQFVTAVAKGRNLDPEFVRQYADGRVFSGEQAVDLGFADMEGSMFDAVALAGKLTGLGSDPPVREEEGIDLWQLLKSRTRSLAGAGGLFEGPGAYYLWTE